jgi:hypothetical protein
MSTGNNPDYVSKALTAGTTTVKSGQGQLGGFFVSSTTVGTIKIYDSLTATGTVLIDTITPTVLGFYQIPTSYGTGLTVVIGGTASITVFYA